MLKTGAQKSHAFWVSFQNYSSTSIIRQGKIASNVGNKSSRTNWQDPWLKLLGQNFA
jgi:hypothetical protein